jgi:S-formylglutathione hydrolase FrmB
MLSRLGRGVIVPFQPESEARPAGKARPALPSLVLEVYVPGSKVEPRVRAGKSEGSPAVGGGTVTLHPFCTHPGLLEAHVEKHFRAKTGPESRALAGLSMGGGQTTRVLTTSPDQFGYVAIWSAGLFGGDPAAFEKQNESFLKNAAGVNKSVKLLEITVGDKDFALSGSKALVGVFEKHGVKHELKITGGGHTWINWRQYLNELAPKLFR